MVYHHYRFHLGINQTMDKYLQQLLTDLKFAEEHVTWPYPEQSQDALSIADWISDEEEDKNAPRIQLEEWTGIQQSQFPPEKLLSDDQVETLYHAISDMLAAYNYSATFIFDLPIRARYEVVRTNFKQEAIQKQWHMGFFELCLTNKAHPDCIMGDYCHCAYFEELSANWVKEDLSPEEERKRALDIEVQHIKRKYGDDYMKYYPFHLDPKYDDENGNPHDYGLGKDEDDEEDNCWRK